MRPKPATKRASRGVILQKEKSASVEIDRLLGEALQPGVSSDSSLELRRVAAHRHSHQRERIGPAVVGLRDRQRDARVLHHVLRVPGEAADVDVERPRNRAPAGTASSTPSARRRAAWRGARCARLRSKRLQQRGGLGVHAIDCSILAPPRCDTSSSSACAIRAPSAATTSSASIPRISMIGIALGVCGADRGAVGDERLPEGGAHAHPRRRLARADPRRRTTASRTGRAWRKIAAQHPRVVATAPFVQAQGMLSQRPGGARRGGARHPARRGGQGRRHRRSTCAPARSTRCKRRRVRHGARRRPRARARRAARRQDRADRAAGHGHARRA